MQRCLVLIGAMLAAAPCHSAPAETGPTTADPHAAGSLPGFLGRTEIETPIPGYGGDQYWTDSDGVDPAVAGCHFPFRGMSAAGACTGPLAPAGVFGEFCNPAEGDPMHQDGFPVGALIESNPAAGVPPARERAGTLRRLRLRRLLQGHAHRAPYRDLRGRRVHRRLRDPQRALRVLGAGAVSSPR